MGKAGRREVYAGKEKESNINQERKVKHHLSEVNTETHAKKMKYTLNGQFIFFRKNLPYSEWVQTLNNNNNNKTTGIWKMPYFQDKSEDAKSNQSEAGKGTNDEKKI